MRGEDRNRKPCSGYVSRSSACRRIIRWLPIREMGTLPCRSVAAVARLYLTWDAVDCAGRLLAGPAAAIFTRSERAAA